MHKNNIYYKAYNLVQNLNQEERTHIRKKLTANLPNHRCIKLFDTLINMKYYDAEEIKGLFNSAVKISTTTHTLIQEIVRYLQFFSEDKLIRLKLDNHACAAAILMSKNAPELAVEELKKGIELAEKFDYKLDIVKFNTILLNNGVVGAIEMDIKEKEQRTNRCRQLLVEIDEGVNINYLALLLSNISTAALTPIDHKDSIEEQLQRIHSEFDDSVFNFQKKTYEVLFLIKIGEWEKANTILEETLEKQEASMYPSARFSFTFLGFSLSISMQDPVKYMLYKNKINTLFETGNMANTGVYTLKKFIELVDIFYCSMLGKNIAGTKLLDEAEDFVKNDTSTHRFNIAEALFIYYFFEKDFDRVISSIIRETNGADYTTMSKKQIYIMRWIEVICYFETKEKQLFNNRALILKRFIEKHRPLNNVEKTLFRFMKSNIDKKQIPADDIAECLTVLKANEKVVRSSFYFFNLFRWLEEKQH